MSKAYSVELTIMTMVYDGDKILVQDRKKKDFSGVSFGWIKKN